MQIVPNRDSLHEMSDSDFCEKYKNIINLSSAELAQWVVKVVCALIRPAWVTLTSNILKGPAEFYQGLRCQNYYVKHSYMKRIFLSLRSRK